MNHDAFKPKLEFLIVMGKYNVLEVVVVFLTVPFSIKRQQVFSHVYGSVSLLSFPLLISLLSRSSQDDIYSSFREPFSYF